MKKTIVSIIIVVLMLTACNQTPFVSANAEKYQYFFFENLDWGMSKEECMKQLNVKDKDLLPLDERDKQEENYEVIKINKKCFGYPAQVTCYFYSNDQYKLGLAIVYVNIEKDKCDLTKVYHQWEKSVGYSGFAKDLPQNKEYLIPHDSPTSVFDVEDKMVLEKANEIFNQISSNPNANRASLSTSRFSYNPNDGTRIGFYGIGAAVLNYSIKEINPEN